jgi:hypothetical protein
MDATPGRRKMPGDRFAREYPDSGDCLAYNDYESKLLRLSVYRPKRARTAFKRLIVIIF